MTSRIQALLRRLGAMAPLLLLACVLGCGKGECKRYEPPTKAGPGDAEGYFPLSAGDHWNVVTTFPAGTLRGWSRVEPAGTQSISGMTAVVLREAEFESGRVIRDSYVAKDSHGVVNLGNTDPADTMTPKLVPYYSARFPIQPGDQFTTVKCEGIDFGADFDGDGKNEDLDVEVVVRVIAIEPVEVPFASFPDAARIETRTWATFHTTKKGKTYTVETRQPDEWYVPGVGLVKRVWNARDGITAIEIEQVAGYSVGGSQRGIVDWQVLMDWPEASPATSFDGDLFLLVADQFPPVTEGGERFAATVVPPGRRADRAHTVLDAGGLSSPSVAFGGGVHLVVVGTWPGGEIRAQRISTAGSPLDGAAGFVVASGLGANPGFPCRGPSVASVGSEFLVVYGRQGLRGARVDPSGAVLGESMLSAEANGCAMVASDGEGYLVLYEVFSFPPPPGTPEGNVIRALRVSPAGAVLDPAPIVISTAPGYKRLVAALFDGTHYHGVWTDSRDGKPYGSLYLARIAPDGKLLDGDPATGGIPVDVYPRTVSEPSASSYGSGVVAGWVDEAGVRVARISSAGEVLDWTGSRPGMRLADLAMFGATALSYPLPFAVDAAGPFELAFRHYRDNYPAQSVHQLRRITFVP